MFNYKEKCDLLVNIREGDIGHHFYTYVTSDPVEMKMCQFLHQKEYISLNNRTYGKYYCRITIAGDQFIADNKNTWRRIKKRFNISNRIAIIGTIVTIIGIIITLLFASK